MTQCRIDGSRIAGIATSVPAQVASNADAASAGFSDIEIRKISAMAGIKQRRVAGPDMCSTDLCTAAAQDLLERLEWAPDSIDALLLVTQSPDYFLPSSACLVQERLGLPTSVAAFDVGLGCSGYPYGLYIASALIKGSGLKRVLLLHGETPSRFTAADDRATALLFGDAGSATAIESAPGSGEASFVLHTDGSGADGLIIRGGGFRDPVPADPKDNYVHMDGKAIFNFTIKRVPPLIEDTLALARVASSDVDYYVMHQSNQFIMKHLMKKCGLPEERVPLCLEKFGNSGGASIPLTVTQTLSEAQLQGGKLAMLLGYGVGLSWASALLSLKNVLLCHRELDPAEL